MNLFFLYIFLLAGLDQAIKFWVRANLKSHVYTEVIPNFIHLTYQENKGVSFSFLADMPDSVRAPLLAGISLVVIVGMGIYFVRDFSKLTRLEHWGFTLILAGAIGNLIDRAFRHSVTDYMYFHFYTKGFFVNNLADDFISIGFVLLVVQGFLIGNKENGKDETP
ncbi:MAG: signal peptidase II [SAR324 cluster bacterium]|nr:signal peptidase II [SAR324 cluster bacterium]